MKILAFNEAFWPSHGGIETFLEDLYTYLHEQGHTVTIACRTEHTGDNPFPFPVHWLPDRDTLHRLIDECDLLHLNAMSVDLLLYARRKGKKVVSSFHDVTMICPKGDKMRWDGPCMKRANPLMCYRCLKKTKSPKPLQRLVRPMAKTLLSIITDKNVVTSQWMQRRYRLFRTQVIEYGVHLERFIPRESIGVPVKPTVGLTRVVFVGRVVPEKGTRLLVRALARCRELGRPFRLIICGDGSYMPELKQAIAEFEVADLVELKGVVRGEELQQVIRSCEIAVVPSRWVEAFGISAIEQMACGLPVIAARSGGLGTIVEGVGLVFPRGDLDGLVEHLVRLLDDPELRQRMGREARVVAEQQYRIERMFKAYEDLFAELTKKHPAASKAVEHA